MMFSTPINSRLATPTGSSMNVAKTWRRKYPLALSWSGTGYRNRYSSCAWSQLLQEEGQPADLVLRRDNL
jgi:hypothetical protein